MLYEDAIELLDFAIEHGCDSELLEDIKASYTDLYNRYCECLKRELIKEKKVALLQRHYLEAIEEI